MNTPIVPLALNRTQQFVHAALEAQKARTGKVRVIIGKGRQTTVSTYVAARFYHKTTFFKGVHTYILTHEQDATDNLFGMVERFQEHNPLRPSTSINNAKELTFDRLGSSYEVGTAGTKAGGRSQTIQMLHWSETAFSPNAKGHFAGIVQTVPDLKGTEIILESTGNGPAGAVVANSTGCSSVYASTFPYNCYNDPWVNSLFQDAQPLAKGIFEGIAAQTVADVKAQRLARLDKWAKETTDEVESNFAKLRKFQSEVAAQPKARKVWA